MRPVATFGARRAGSCRFDAYYKVQVWLLRSLAWLDIQLAHATPEAARAAYLPGERCRTMRIDMAGRGPLPGSDTEEAT